MSRIVCETQDGKKIIRDVSDPVIRIGAYGVLKKGNKFLLTKSYLPLWEFPGGGIEKDETILDALKREFLEETGIRIKPLKFILCRECFYYSPTGTVFHSIQNFYSVKALGKSIVSGSNTQWVATDSLSLKSMKKSAYDAFLKFRKKRNNSFVSVLKKTTNL